MRNEDPLKAILDREFWELVRGQLPSMVDALQGGDGEYRFNAYHGDTGQDVKLVTKTRCVIPVHGLSRDGKRSIIGKYIQMMRREYLENQRNCVVAVLQDGYLKLCIGRSNEPVTDSNDLAAVLPL